MNNNHMPGNWLFNQCNCRGEINELQRRINHLDNRINRLENMLFNNNWRDYSNEQFLNNENRNYTNGNYIL